MHGEGKFKSLLLEPEAVVEAIFKQILSENSGQVILPGQFNMLSGARGWPSWMQEMLRSSQENVLDH